MTQLAQEHIDAYLESEKTNRELKSKVLALKTAVISLVVIIILLMAILASTIYFWNEEVKALDLTNSAISETNASLLSSVNLANKTIMHLRSIQQSEAIIAGPEHHILGESAPSKTTANGEAPQVIRSNALSDRIYKEGNLLVDSPEWTDENGWKWRFRDYKHGADYSVKLSQTPVPPPYLIIEDPKTAQPWYAGIELVPQSK